MKALVIDSSSSNMIISARNEDKTMTVSCDMGMKQSEKILPLVDFVLSEVNLDAKDIEWTALTSGPGTFTGLRLGYSVLKALTLAFNTPIYGINTMEMIAFPFIENGFKNKIIIPVIDAKKDQAFACIFENGEMKSEIEDIEPSVFFNKIKDNKNEIIVTGPIAKSFVSQFPENNLNITVFDSPMMTTDSLFKIAQKMIENGKKPLEDYDGPEYFRKSEAEINFKA